MTHQALIVLLRKFQQREDGAVAIIFALLILFVFVPILAVSTEMGLRTMEQRKLQHQADMAAYSAVVALSARFPDEPRVGGTCPPQLGVDAANLAASGSQYRGPVLECSQGTLKNVLLVDKEKLLEHCGIPTDLDSFDGLCVRLTLDQDRLFSRVFSLFTNQDADQAVRLSALAVAQFGGGRSGILPCITARGNITAGNNNDIDAPNCAFSSQGNITFGAGSRVDVGVCQAKTITASSGMCGSQIITPDPNPLPVPRGLEWVTDPAAWNRPLPGYCRTNLPGSGVNLSDGQIYCINSSRTISGAESTLRSGGPKGNLIILGPNVSLDFRGNAGFEFDALTWRDLPSALQGSGPEPQGFGAEGILIYGPNGGISFGGNSDSLIPSDGCQGMFLNTLSFSGNADLRIRIGCDPEREGNEQFVPPEAQLGLAF